MTENQRVAIVTGAAGGIGRAMTRALLVNENVDATEPIAGGFPCGGHGAFGLHLQKRGG